MWSFARDPGGTLWAGTNRCLARAGLGLSICHGIISALGGQIAIESAPGRGTVVRVVLPAHVAVAAAAPEAAPAPEVERAVAAEQRRYRVMLVDDEPMVAQTIERLLRRDYDVTVAQCGQDALADVASGVRSTPSSVT